MDPELAAMQGVLVALEKLETDAQGRVVNWVIGRLKIETARRPNTSSTVLDGGGTANEDEEDKVPAAPAGVPAGPQVFAQFADLYDAAQPKSDAQRALIGGYWLQVCKGAADFPSQAVNSELKNLGYPVSNITSAFESLKNSKPTLAMQIKKSGTTQQARKKFKITAAGVKAVEALLQASS